MAGERIAHPLVTGEAMTVEDVVDVRVVRATAVGVHESEQRVHARAVVRRAGAVVVARRDPEQGAIAPFARASTPRVDCARRDREDARAQVAAAGRPVRARGVRGAAGHVTARAAVGAGLGLRVVGAGSHRAERVVEPSCDRREVVGGIDHPFTQEAADEVGPHHAQRFGPQLLRDAQDRDPHRLELERVVDGHPALPEVELAELPPAVGFDEDEIDPSAEPYAAAGEHGRLVDPVLVERGGTVAEHPEVPAHGVGEDRGFLRLEAVGDPGELLPDRDPQLGVRVAGAPQERVAHPGPVDRIVGSTRALHLERQPPRAHLARPAQEERSDLRQHVRVGHEPRLGGAEPATGDFVE